jgi:hypothetical protein
MLGARPHQRYLRAEFLQDKSEDTLRYYVQYGQLLAGIGGRLDRGHG